MDKKITSYQGLIRLKAHQKKPVAAIIVGLFFTTVSVYLLYVMDSTRVLNEAPGLLKYFGETYLYFSLFGLFGLCLFVFGIFRLIFPKKH